MAKTTTVRRLIIDENKNVYLGELGDRVGNFDRLVQKLYSVRVRCNKHKCPKPCSCVRYECSHRPIAWYKQLAKGNKQFRNACIFVRVHELVMPRGEIQVYKWEEELPAVQTAAV